MEEIRIGFGPAGKRGTKLRMAGIVILFGGIAAVMFVVDAGGNGAVVAAAVGVALVVALTTLVNHGWGTTTLAPAGMVLASLTSRRTVPWDRISRIEVRRRTGRYGNTWMEARILLTDAPPLRLPGLQQASGGQSKEEFQGHVGVLLHYWQQETGRTEAVLVRP